MFAHVFAAIEKVVFVVNVKLGSFLTSCLIKENAIAVNHMKITPPAFTPSLLFVKILGSGLSSE
jgi:hypothetical protein